MFYLDQPATISRLNSGDLSMSSTRNTVAAKQDGAALNGHDADDRPATLRPAKVDIPRIERAVREILLAVGEDPDREGLLKTPNRVARAYGELFAGLQDNPRRHLKTVFREQYDEVVLLRDIEFNSMCEHHLLPFTGHAHLAYLPAGKVVGLSKLARLVEGFARRPQVQERLTTQIADALMEELNPVGAVCVIEATHTCMTIRGAAKPGAMMVTSALRGIFKENPSSRAEVLALISGSRSNKA
jgi:GTP cyclohydrolase I